MSDTAQQSDWRRGGPGLKPIDRVGVWERRAEFFLGESQWLLVESLAPESIPKYCNHTPPNFYTSGGSPLGSIQRWSESEWRFIGPLPGEPEPREDGKKGDREALWKAFHEAQEAWNRCLPLDEHSLIECDELSFLESPAGRSAVLSLWGEQKEACETCGGTNIVKSGCVTCGAPVCCQTCCQIDSLIQQRDSLSVALAEAALEAAALRAELDETVAALAEARKEIETLKSQMDEAVGQTITEKREVDRLRGVLGRAFSALEAGGHSPNAPIEVCIQNLIKGRASLAAERDALRSRLTAAEAKVEELEDVAKNKDARIEWLKGERQALRTQVASAHMALNRAGSPEDGSLQNKVDWAVSRLSAPSADCDAKTDLRREFLDLVVSDFTEAERISELFRGLVNVSRGFQ